MPAHHRVKSLLTISEMRRSPRQKALIALLIEQRKKSGLTQAQLAKRLRRYQSFVATPALASTTTDVVLCLFFMTIPIDHVATSDICWS